MLNNKFGGKVLMDSQPATLRQQSRWHSNGGLVIPVTP